MNEAPRPHPLDVRAAVAGLVERLRADLIGRETLIERLVVALLAGGHVLVEGAPGLAKTRAVKALAGALDASFTRVQATPDLLPGDLTGTTVFRAATGTFEFVAGPLFHDLVLVDEVNRAPPKVQSALLEAMGERQVTVAGVTRPLSEVFTVVATENPIEHEGTYPLPEAQLDRFLFHVEVPLPGAAEERAILDLADAESRAAPPPTRVALSVPTLLAARREAMATHLAPAARDLIVRLVMATRGEGAAAPPAGLVEHPASPRGSIALAVAAKARAWLDGRDHVRPDDVLTLAPDALAHRIGLTYRARAEGTTARGLVAGIAERVPVL